MRPSPRTAKLAEDGAGGHAGDRLAVDLDVQEAVEQQEHVAPRLALLDERLANLEPLTRQPGVEHQGDAGQLVLESSLDRGDDLGRVLVSPGRRFAERLAVPAVEILQAVLAYQPAAGVVDGVARKGAGRDQASLRLAGRMEDELQRRPCERRAEVEIPLALNRPRCRQADAAAHGL